MSVHGTLIGQLCHKMRVAHGTSIGQLCGEVRGVHGTSVGQIYGEGCSWDIHRAIVL